MGDEFCFELDIAVDPKTNGGGECLLVEDSVLASVSEFDEL